MNYPTWLVIVFMLFMLSALSVEAAKAKKDSTNRRNTIEKLERLKEKLKAEPVHSTVSPKTNKVEPETRSNPKAEEPIQSNQQQLPDKISEKIESVPTKESAQDHSEGCLAPDPAPVAPDVVVIQDPPNHTKTTLDLEDEIRTALGSEGLETQPQLPPSSLGLADEKRLRVALDEAENPKHNPHQHYMAMNVAQNGNNEKVCATCGFAPTDGKTEKSIISEENASVSFSASISVSMGSDDTFDLNTQCRLFEDLTPTMQARLVQLKLSKLARRHHRQKKHLLESIQLRQKNLLQARDEQLALVPGFWFTALKALPNFPLYSIPFGQQQSSVNLFEAPEDKADGGRLWRLMSVDDGKLFKHHLTGIHCSRFIPSQIIPTLEREAKKRVRVGSAAHDDNKGPIDELLAAVKHLAPDEEHYNISFTFANHWKRETVTNVVSFSEAHDSEVPPQGAKILSDTIPKSDDPAAAFPFTGEEERTLPHYFPFTQKSFTKYIAVLSAKRSSPTYGDSSSHQEEHSSVTDKDNVYKDIAQSELDAFDRSEFELEKEAEERAVGEGMAVVDQDIEAEERTKSALQSEEKKSVDDDKIERKNSQKNQKKNRRERLAEYLSAQRAIRATNRQNRRIVKNREVQDALEASRQTRLTELQKTWEAKTLDNYRHEYGVGTVLDWGSAFVGIERGDVIPFLTGMNWNIEGYQEGNAAPHISARRRLLSHTMPVPGSFLSFFQPHINYRLYTDRDRSMIKMRLYGFLADICGPLAVRPIDIFEEFFIEEEFRRQREEDERRASEALAEIALERLAREAEAAAMGVEAVEEL